MSSATVRAVIITILTCLGLMDTEFVKQHPAGTWTFFLLSLLAFLMPTFLKINTGNRVRISTNTTTHNQLATELTTQDTYTQ